MRFSLLAMLGVLFGEPLLAQDLIATRDLPETPSCRECRLHVREIVQLGSMNDPVGFGPLAYVAVNTRGEYAVSSATFPGEIFIYSPRGALLRSVGRRGRGPGEFEGQLLLQFDATDSLHVVEFRGGRHTVLAPDYSYVRSSRMQSPPSSFAVLADGGLLLAAATSEQPPHTLQFVSREGRVVRTADRDSRGLERPRLVGAGPGDAVWSVSAVDYTLRRWSQRGDLLQQIKGRRAWLSGEPLPLRLNPREPPPAQITGVSVDSAGMLRIYFAVADLRWQPPVGGTTPDPNSLYDTIVEVVDPPSGQLLARHRLDDIVMPLAGTKAYAVRADAIGERKVVILDLLLRR